MEFFSFAVGLASGLGLAALGFTYKSIAIWVEGKAKVVEAQVATLEAQATAHRALSAAVANVKITASVPPAPAAPAAAPPAA